MKFGKIHIKKDDLEKFEYKNLKYFILDDNFIEDTKYENIFIGFNETRKLYGDVIILDHKIKDNVRWMFSHCERTQEFNEDLPIILDKIIANSVRKIEYEFIDPIVDELYSSNELIKVVPNNLFTVIKNEMIYSYSENTEIIYGFNLDYLQDLNIDIISFMSLLKNKSIKLSNFDSVDVPDLDLEVKYYPLFL